MSYTKYPKGSIWRKWDLHVHTPLDHEWINRPDLYNDDNKQNFAKNFISFAKKEQIDILCITDHNFCNTVEDSLISFIQLEADQNDITILPGFEISAKDGSGIHLLVIFPERTPLKTIKGIVDQCFPPNTVLIPESGCIPVSNKSIDEIKQIVDDAGQEAIFIFAHADRENGVLDPKTIKGTRRVQEWKKDFINIAQIAKSTNEYPENCFMYNVINKNDNHYKRDITYIISSDCRTIKKEDARQNRLYLGGKYVWIKADPTFEGLKQIIYEPDGRVKIQQEEPEAKTPYTIIDAVRFIDSRTTKEFSDNWIKLNPNLNSIIGGKSSGKSLLLYHIAKTIDAERINNINNDEKSTYKKIEYSFEKESEFDCEVKWADGATYKLKDAEKEKPNRPITYIPQLYLNRLVEDPDQKHELNNIVDKMLIESSGEYKKFRNKTKQKTDVLRTKMFEVIDEYYKVKNTLIEKEAELKEFGDEKAITENKKELIQKIATLRKESSFSEKEEKKYNNLAEKIKNLKEQQSETSILIDVLAITKERYEAFKSDIQNSLDKTVFSSINSRFPALSQEISKKISDIISQTVTKLQNTLDGEIDDRFSSMQAEQMMLSEVKENIKTTEKELEPLEEKVKNKNVFSQLQKKLKTESAKLKVLNEKQIEIKKLRKYLSTVAIKNKYGELFTGYLKIVKENQKYESIPDTDNLKLNSIIRINEEEFNKNFVFKINKKRSLNQQFGNFFNAENDYEYNQDKHLDNINIIVDKITSGGISFNAGYDEKHTMLSLLDDYFSIDYNLLQDGDDLIKMSPGKRGIILFQLFLHLSKSENPILIDQPEDNLDNRTVYQELNDFIKTKKTVRQIIIVSHNPNLVVSTDSENIIVANQDGQNKSGKNNQFKFEYVNGAIEHSFTDENKSGILFKSGIRQHVCDILEGGEEAFEKRENKYGFK